MRKLVLIILLENDISMLSEGLKKTLDLSTVKYRTRCFNSF